MAERSQAPTDLQNSHGAKEIVVVGGGGHAKVVISILRKLNRYGILGYTDHKNHGAVLGVAFLGSDSELNVLASEARKLSAVLAVGQVGLGETRYKLWMALQLPYISFPRIVSPGAVINEEVVIGEGTVVMDGAVINSGSSIGHGAIINTNCTIEHDVGVAEWVHVAPGATISGGVTVGRFSMIGAGATVIEGVKIEAGCMVGAGATVVQDLTEPGVYAGSPARLLR